MGRVIGGMMKTFFRNLGFLLVFSIVTALAFWGGWQVFGHQSSKAFEMGVFLWVVGAASLYMAYLMLRELLGLKQ